MTIPAGRITGMASLPLPDDDNEDHEPSGKRAPVVINPSPDMERLEVQGRFATIGSSNRSRRVFYATPTVVDRREVRTAIDAGPDESEDNPARHGEGPRSRGRFSPPAGAGRVVWFHGHRELILRTEPYGAPHLASHAQLADSIFTGAMTRLYGWIALGVVTTGAVGWLSHRAGVMQVVEGFGLLGYLGVLGVWIGCLLVLHVLSGRVPPAVAGVLYLAFSAVTGVVISHVFWEHTGDTIALAFALTTAVFVAMSVVGYTTKRDLSGLGTICLAGLLGVVVAGVANWFIGSNLLSWIITLAALPIFLGLTIYETKQVKELAQQAATDGDERAAGRVAVMGAVGLYLSFLNIFLILLRILDAFSGD